MRIECFIDADNIPCPSAEGWGAELEAELVGCRHRRAYGVGKTIGTELSRWLYTHNFEVIDAFSPVSGKNSADIRMTLGIAERALGGERGAEGAARFVIVSGDSDFTPVLSKLHEWGHELCLVAPDGHLASAAERIGAKVIRIR
ncbi:MAG: NYN domain-containing protein, partial [Deltaproteobacteria bacterium]|nr:NYN domain-containing protein [Deltaproteobacteria bacterium]